MDRSLSIAEVEQIAGRPFRTFVFKDLKNMRNIMDMFDMVDGVGSALILYRSAEDYGHWCALNCREFDDKIEIDYFDSFGGHVDAPPTLLPEDTQHELEETSSYIVDMIMNTNHVDPEELEGGELEEIDGDTETMVVPDDSRYSFADTYTDQYNYDPSLFTYNVPNPGTIYGAGEFEIDEDTGLAMYIDDDGEIYYEDSDGEFEIGDEGYDEDKDDEWEWSDAESDEKKYVYHYNHVRLQDYDNATCGRYCGLFMRYPWIPVDEFVENFTNVYGTSPDKLVVELTDPLLE